MSPACSDQRPGQGLQQGLFGWTEFQASALRRDLSVSPSQCIKSRVSCPGVHPPSPGALLKSIFTISRCGVSLRFCIPNKPRRCSRNPLLRSKSFKKGALSGGMSTKPCWPHLHSDVRTASDSLSPRIQSPVRLNPCARQESSCHQTAQHRLFSCSRL